MFGDVIQRVKPPFSELLLTTRLVQCHHQKRFFRVEIGRRIIKCQMSVLTNPDKSGVYRILLNQFSQVFAFFLRILRFAIYEMKGFEMRNVGHKAFLEIFSKTSRMRFRKPQIFIKMKGRDF